MPSKLTIDIREMDCFNTFHQIKLNGENEWKRMSCLPFNTGFLTRLQCKQAKQNRFGVWVCFCFCFLPLRITFNKYYTHTHSLSGYLTITECLSDTWREWINYIVYSCSWDIKNILFLTFWISRIILVVSVSPLCTAGPQGTGQPLGNRYQVGTRVTLSIFLLSGF